MQFFQFIESWNSEKIFLCAAFRVFSIYDNQYFDFYKIVNILNADKSEAAHIKVI